MQNKIKLLTVGLLLLGSHAFTQDFTGIKIYINPGHGGHDSDDRYIAATGYWESEGNLTKGLYLRDLLERLGATVIMSRTQNRTIDDRKLSEIDAEANANNVDYFHSIHSNAYDATSNYPLLLFRGYDNAPVFPDAKRMGHIMWTEMNKLDRQWTYWPYSSENNRGDWDFYSNWGTSGLGVLRTLEMPGTLSEGSFHDYIPNSWRLQCIDYRKHESIVILRSFIDYFGLDPLPYGLVAGLTRAENQNVTYSYNYNSGLPNDKKRAINHAKVTLLPQNKIYITDDNNNGFFMFDSLSPGSYQLVFDGGEYDPDTVNVTVRADETVFANAFLTEDADKAPEIYLTSPADSAEGVNTYSDITIVFSQEMDTAATDRAFSLNPHKRGALFWSYDNKTMFFRPDSAYTPSTRYHITLSDSAKNSVGQHLDQEYSFSFTTASHHIYPTIISYQPSEQEDSVFIYSDIEIEFSQQMNPEETEVAFRVEPSIEGQFEWDNEYKKLSYIPDHFLLADTLYHVSISPQAVNSYAVGLQDTFSFLFKTRKNNELEIARSFPADGETGVASQMYFFLQFAHPIDYNSYSKNNFEIASENGEIIPLRKLLLSSEGGIYRITFKPKTVLDRSKNYVLTIFPGMASTDGFRMRDTLYVHFRTDSSSRISGTVIDPFEDINKWQSPLDNNSTNNVDSAATGMLKNYSVKMSGSSSGWLFYGFNKDSGGICRIYDFNRPSLGDDPEAEFGIWVFGDFSKNILEFWFDQGDSTQILTLADTLNWYGWKFLHFPIKQTGAGGEVFFQSIVVRQTTDGFKNGNIYFDDLQSKVVVGLQDQSSTHLIARAMQLYQSYPNPFNPTTKIEFFLPASGKTQLLVYNILGQKVREVLNKQLPAGKHQVIFRAKGLASGVYIYELKSASGVLRRRMLLLK